MIPSPLFVSAKLCFNVTKSVIKVRKKGSNRRLTNFLKKNPLFSEKITTQVNRFYLMFWDAETDRSEAVR